MRVYKTGEIRNVSVVGHGASGKTPLVDARAFVPGTGKLHGSVQGGLSSRAVSDDRYVADLTWLVHAHGRSSLRQGIGRI